MKGNAAQTQQNRKLTGGKRPSSSLLGSITPTSGIAMIMTIVGIGWVWISNDQSNRTFDMLVIHNRELRGIADELIDNNDIHKTMKITTKTTRILFDATQNAEDMAQWRATTETECKKILEDKKNNHMGKIESLKRKLQVEKDAIGRLQLPDDAFTMNAARPEDHRKYEKCKNAFIDLGTNIGDSIGYFIDNSLDVCSPIWMEQNPYQKINREFPRPHVSVTDTKISNEGLQKANPLFGMLQREMKSKDGMKFQPETFCVYGMEGNPEFTQQLQRLENYVMDIRPRPVQHLHIHTESVVTAVDGPTKLYLDKTSVKENFWGSSILSSQQDAQKSAKELNNGEVFSADVEGISLSRLVRSTMAPFYPGASDGEKKGGLLIIKMDVEGAEYQVLKEVAANGVLCDYARMGNRVYFIVEYHKMSITNAKERRREKEGHQEAKRKLEECGIEFGNLSASWH